MRLMVNKIVAILVIAIVLLSLYLLYPFIMNASALLIPKPQQNSVVVSGRITTGILTRPVSVAFMSRSRGTRYSTSIDGRGDYAISLLGNDTYNVVVYYGGIFGNATSPDCDSHVLALNGNADMANLTLSC